ncbi:MAG: hypothetical protein NTX03_08385 [Bacteroidetes bacterium]|nr:hypothetical protein [Bacteroidota bacterium]
MERILFLLNDTTGSNYLVDHNKYPSHQSPWNNCDLIFNWGAGHSDTLKNFDIRYSRFEDRKECHEDDPYVRIDKVEYYHKNKKMGKNDKIIIEF